MKNLFLKLGLLPALILAATTFVSCGGNEPELPDNSVISARNVVAVGNGNINDIASVRAGFLNTIWSDRFPVLRYEILGEAPFQNSGFTMQLPATLPDNFLRLVTDLFPDFAEITVTGNSNARWLPGIDLVAFDESGNEIGVFNLVGEIDIENRTGTTVRWVYVDSNVSVIVPNTATRWGQTFVYYTAANLNLRKGWNIVYATISVENIENISHITTTLTTQRPSGVFFAWTFISLEDEFPFSLLDGFDFFDR